MNIIQIPFDHKMFNESFSGSIDNFIFDDFALLFTKQENIEIALRVFFKCENGDITGTQIHLVKLHEEWIKNISYEVRLSDEKECGFNVFCNSDDEKYLNIGFHITEIVFKTILYIMNTPRDKIIKPKTSKEKKEKTTRIPNSNTNKIYLLDEIVDYVNENGLTISPGKHIINCPCWSVRGHYRHYKSGKVVFIKNYEKGKEKGKVKPKDKTYAI
nr:MAG TPA: hypothetical protein [Bacteriophage sp.]